MKKHLVSIWFKTCNGWFHWIGFVPDDNGKCIVYPNQIFKRITGKDMPPYTKIQF